MKLSFKNDYTEGCHPSILELLAKDNMEQEEGYGLDGFSNRARTLIKAELKNDTATVHFVSGGTQANLIAISSVLRPHECVIAAQTGHVFANETGAIEATGHKVSVTETQDGKLTPEDVQKVLNNHPLQPHQLKPKLVFISNATETGTIYTLAELEKLSAFCKQNDLLLYLDGARLGHALMAKDNDLTLESIAKLVDMFYIGGTKNGALLGEAIVIVNPSLQTDFAYHLKQKGAMLAKERLLGIQFCALFRDGLFYELADHANQQAMKLKQAFKNKGFAFLNETTTNQIFPILANSQIEQLAKKFDFITWKKIDQDHAVIRLITSWAVSDQAIQSFIKEIKAL